jgi:hypothetical protein
LGPSLSNQSAALFLQPADADANPNAQAELTRTDNHCHKDNPGWH